MITFILCFRHSATNAYKFRVVDLYFLFKNLSSGHKSYFQSDKKIRPATRAYF